MSTTLTLLALALPTTFFGWIVFLIAGITVVILFIRFLKWRGVVVPAEAVDYAWIVAGAILVLIAIWVVLEVASRI